MVRSPIRWLALVAVVGRGLEVVPEAGKVRDTDVAHTGSGNDLSRTDVVARVAISLATVNA